MEVSKASSMPYGARCRRYRCNCTRRSPPLTSTTPDTRYGSNAAIRRLAQVCEDVFAERYPPSNRRLLNEARARLDTELALIDELGLAGFFLLHWEVLELAREIAAGIRGPGSPRRWLPPGRGRGSSVGSIVCYLTGLSHVDPVKAGLFLGRFLNDELSGVPDIDLDFPRDIREKLIVRVTERYGHDHAALVSSFATYRSRGAIRDVGKALGLPAADLERLEELIATGANHLLLNPVADYPEQLEALAAVVGLK